MKKDKGLALIIVLWVITLLIIMASSFSLTIQREAVIISGLKEKAEASAIAEAGIHYAILKLLHNDKEQQWQAFNSLYEISYNERRVRIQISDESGKIAINQVKKEQLLSVFESINVEESIAESLSDAIIDWRDSDDVVTENGAELEEYETAGLKYGPRNAAFSNIEEIQMVLGMTADIYKKMENIISIYTQKPQINPASASRELLLTLPDVDEEMVDDYMKQRVENEQNSENVSQPSWFTGNATKSDVFMIVAEAMIDENITQQIMAIIKKGNSTDNLPFKILKWTKDYQLPSLFLSENDEWVIN
ncbi:MAG: general secretion pathway protein GspK [Methylococcales bacterium]|nr:general secretion pathway protein GspK [Methylococcales bacterium]